MGSPTRREREKEFKRQLITEAAARLFTSGSFESVTVEDIAREAEFGKGTIYSHFESKEEILCAVVCQGIEELTQRLGESCRGLDAVAALSCIIKLQYDYYQHFSRIFISLLLLQADEIFDSVLGARIREKHEAKSAMVASILQKGVDQRIFRVNDAPQLARIIENTVKGFALEGVEKQSFPTPPADFELVEQTLKGGIILNGGNVQ